MRFSLNTIFIFGLFLLPDDELSLEHPQGRQRDQGPTDLKSPSKTPSNNALLPKTEGLADCSRLFLPKLTKK